MTMYPSRNSSAGQLLRALLSEVDDSGPQQFVKVTGVAGQTIAKAVRSQPFGFSSNPPSGAEGLALLIGGGMDRAHLLGLEHPKYRPTNLPSGGAIVYDYEGNFVKVVHGEILVKHAKQFTVQIGDVSLTVSQNGVAVQGGKVTHNGLDIGATHVHGQVTPGGGVTGVPSP